MPWSLAAGGSQYCTWHSDSRLLAVSSDTLKAVVVFDAIRREAVAVFEHLRRPCLALAFVPAPCLAQSPTLVFAENARNVYIAGRQSLSPFNHQRLVARLCKAHINPEPCNPGMLVCLFSLMTTVLIV